VQYIYKSFSSDFQIDIRDEDFIEFLDKRMHDFKMLVERQPVLWKWNSACYKVANVFDNDDIIYPDALPTVDWKEEEELDKLQDLLGWGEDYDEE
jgi:hypothetical protein